MADITSRPYKPDSQKCCEACAFGRGAHAWWCEAGLDALALQLVEAALFDADRHEG